MHLVNENTVAALSEARVRRTLTLALDLALALTLTLTPALALALALALAPNPNPSQACGVALHPDRFRPNLIVGGELPAWEEFSWVGREVRLGEATLRVISRTVRCEGL